VLLLDGNIPEVELGRVFVPFDTVSTAKAIRMRALVRCDVCTPNVDELIALCGGGGIDKEINVNTFSALEIDKIIRFKFAPLYPQCSAVVVTCGSNGCVVWERKRKKTNSTRISISSGISLNMHMLKQALASLKKRVEIQVVSSLLQDSSTGEENSYLTTWINPLTPVKSVLNCTGAGDSLCGAAAIVKAAAAENITLCDAVLVGMFAAEQSLQSESAVNPSLSETLRGLWNASKL